MQLLSYILTITMGIILGALQMKKAEVYWTFEYYQYAIDYQEAYEKKLQEEKERKEQEEKLKAELEKEQEQETENVNL